MKPETDPTLPQPALFLIQAHFSFRKPIEAQMVANFIAEACPNPRLAVVGITEMFMNAIEHGNLDISFEEKSKLQGEEDLVLEIERRLTLPENLHKTVEVEMTKTKTELSLTVTDQGKGFNWRQYQNLDDRRIYQTHGRGIALAKNLVFSKIQYSDKGNQVTCTVPLQAISSAD
jgi:sigma-B regulation protein RsbU (phosphoserine phosphatase)